MSQIRRDLHSHIGMRLYFPEHNMTYEIEGYIPLEVGQTLTITEDFETAFTHKYKSEDWEPPTGNYVVHAIDSPTLYRYNRYHVPDNGNNNWMRLSQRVTLAKARLTDAEEPFYL
ncbi:hypothetical protein EXS74_02065 [Candidatus Woesearchaeota archaeon]|nr:hypothetical protein [Candidatus Woesearchaeota archaeon]